MAMRWLIGGLVVAVLACGRLPGDDRPKDTDAEYTSRIEQALRVAGENAAEIRRALADVPAPRREAMRFLVAFMPAQDLRELSADFLLENVEYACRAWDEAPWKAAVPHAEFLNAVLPYTSVSERRDNWRKDFYTRFKPLVQDLPSAAAAAARLNQQIFSQLNVRYSTKRRRADQGPYESIETGLASCTGLSILLIDACRAVGVPARFVGTPRWSDNSGNHSWVEIWDTGWHFTGAAEPSGDEVDRAWFTGRAAKASRDEPLHAIYAVSYRETPLQFPLVWSRRGPHVFAVNVTDRYTRQTAQLPDGAIEVMFQVVKQAGTDRCAAQIRITGPNGDEVFSGTSKDERFDANDQLVAVLPGTGPYNVRAECDGISLETRIDAANSGQLFTLDLSKARAPAQAERQSRPSTP